MVTQGSRIGRFCFGDDGRRTVHSRNAFDKDASDRGGGSSPSLVRRSPPLRFRCQVGHGYTADALSNEQESSVDEAMRVALRIVEERAVLSQKMADEARQDGLMMAGASYERRAKESREHIETLRAAIRGVEGRRVRDEDEIEENQDYG